MARRQVYLEYDVVNKWPRSVQNAVKSMTKRPESGIQDIKKIV